MKARNAIVTALACAIFLCLAWRFRDHKVDDAFISFRYAENAAAGHGLVFNPGERVEGYTNFLWVVLLAGGIKLGISPETLSLLLGVAAAAGLIVVVTRASIKLGLGTATVWVAPALLAVSPALSVWATGGLETTFYAFLLTLGVCRLAEEVEAGTPRIASAVVFGLASLTRPEGALFGGLMSAVLLAQFARTREGRLAWARWSGAFFAIFLSYFLWRFNYYGYLLPNTFYAKVDVGGSQVSRGLRYFSAFGAAIGYWLLLPLAGLASIRRKALAIIAAVVAAQLAFVVFVGGDGLPMYRFFVPMLGLLFLLIAWGTETLLNRFEASKTMRTIAATLLALSCVYSARGAFTGPQYLYVKQDEAEVGAWTEIGRWFHDNAKAGESIGVVPAGAVPYYSELLALDMLGLNDVTIAHTAVGMGGGQAGHEKYNTAYVLERAPTYLLLGTYRLYPSPDSPWQHLTPYYPVEAELLASPEFRTRYRIRQGKAASGYFGFFERI